MQITDTQPEFTREIIRGVQKDGTTKAYIVMTCPPRRIPLPISRVVRKTVSLLGV